MSREYRNPRDCENGLATWPDLKFCLRFKKHKIFESLAFTENGDGLFSVTALAPGTARGELGKIWATQRIQKIRIGGRERTKKGLGGKTFREKGQTHSRVSLLFTRLGPAVRCRAKKEELVGQTL